MTLITEGARKYRVYYIRRYLPTWPAKPGEKDYQQAYGDTPEQATEYVKTHLAAIHSQDTRYTYQIMPALTEVCK